MRFRHFTPRDSFFGTVLKCSDCRCERREARGIIRVGKHLEEMCYLACECAAPKGVVKV